MKKIYPQMPVEKLAALGFQYTGEFRHIKKGDRYVSCDGNAVFIAHAADAHISDGHRWIVVPLKKASKPEKLIKLPNLKAGERDFAFPDLGETRAYGNLGGKGLYLSSNQDIVFSVEIDNQGAQVLVARKAKE